MISVARQNLIVVLPLNFVSKLIPLQANMLHNHSVADTFWSVDIKCCFHQKKTKSRRSTTGTRPAERQHKGREQSSTKNVTSKTSRLHSVAKQHKVSDRSVWNPKTNCIQIKFDLEKQRAKNEEKKQAELKKT